MPLMEGIRMISSHASVCRFCAAGCPIIVDMEDNRAVRVTGNKTSPTYHGFCCTRGQAMPEQLYDPERLLQSRKKDTDGRHQPIASAKAVEEIAEQVRRAVDKYGPDSVALYFGTYSAHYAATAPFGRAWMTALGSKMVFSANTIDQPGKDIASAMIGSWEAGANSFASSDVWISVGGNPLVSILSSIPTQNPARLLTQALDRGMKLIVIDPRRTETARRAHVHLQAKPGTDAVILAAMINVILREDLHDQDFAVENVGGLEALREHVARFDPEAAGRHAGVDADQIIEAARIFANANRGIAAGATGSSMSGNSTITEYLIQSLNAICGRYIREGEAVPNPGVLLAPAIPRAQARPIRPAVDKSIEMTTRGLSRSAAGMPTSALPDEILAGKIRVLFSAGGNPAAAWPDQRKTIAALEALDLFVQIDVKMSASARLADYVIAPKLGLEVPTASYAIERLEYFAAWYGLQEPFGIYAPALIDTPVGSDLLEEWELFYGLAQQLGLQLVIDRTNPLNGVRREQLPSIPVDMATKPTMDQLLDSLTSGSRIPLSTVKQYPEGALYPGEILTAPKDQLCTTKLEVGNAEIMDLLSSLPLEPQEQDEGFPFKLIARRAAHAYNSTGLGLPLLQRKGGRFNPTYLHPEDMDLLGVSENELVEIRSRHGAIQGIVKPDANLRRNMVSMTHAFGVLPDDDDQDIRNVGSNVNLLSNVNDDYDPYSGIPRMSGIAVALSPAR
jgi:anaerobic selenocysteine-containing dehydrogenase